MTRILTLLVLGLCLHGLHAPVTAANPSSRVLALDPNADRVIVAGSHDASLRILDRATGEDISGIPLADDASSIALHPGTGRAVIGHEQAGRVSIVDTSGSSQTMTLETGPEPGAVAIDSTRDIALVVNRGDDTVSLIDLTSATVMATLPTGMLPADVAVNSRTGIAVVSNERGESLTLVDLERRQVSATLPVTAGPGAVAIDERENHVLVLHPRQDSLSLIDLATGERLARVPAGETPVAVAVDPLYRQAVVAGYKDDSLTLIDLSSRMPVATLSAGASPIDIVLDAGRRSVVVVNEAAPGFKVIRLDEIPAGRPVPTGRHPVGVAIHPSRAIALVANRKGDSVSVLSLPSGDAVEVIDVGKSPFEVAIDADRQLAAVTLEKADRVALIDLQTWRLLTTLEVGRRPGAVAIDATGGIAIVANRKDDTLSLVELDTAMVTATIPVGRDPRGVALQPSKRRAWVTLGRDDTVQVIDLDSRQVVDTLAVGRRPAGIAVSDAHDIVAVVNEVGDSLMVIDAGSHEITRDVDVARGPRGVAIDEHRGRIHIVSRVRGRVSMVEIGGAGVIETLETGRQPERVAVSPWLGVQVVTNRVSDDVSIFMLPKTPPPLPPDADRITIGEAVDGQVMVSGGNGSVVPGSEVTVTNLRTGESVTAVADGYGGFTVILGGQAGDSYALSVTDVTGSESEVVELTTDLPVALPPDPATVAPAPDPTVALPMHVAAAFLYSGEEPIQRDLTPGVIDPERVAVLRGRIRTRDGNPLSGVTMTVHQRPGYGHTLSRTDGMFDLVVNGGATVVIRYEKAGYLPVQRRIDVPLQDYAWLPEVVMIPPDEAVTPIDLASNLSMQVARGSEVTDALGTRRATILFPQGTTASMTLPDGTTRPLDRLSVRATEYTVGATGPAAMPGELPPASAYTYAVELGVDEAVEAGANRVDFSRPLPFLVENYRGFPVGTVVPVGWYDHDRALWIPSGNGRVIEVVGMDAGGHARIDVDGSGSPAGVDRLSALGITDDERRQLAGLYAPGTRLFRAPVTHFTPFDCNFPWGPPEDAVSPPVPPPDALPPDEEQDVCPGCEIRPQSQTLGEAIPITGTTRSLHYQSGRMPGHAVGNTLRVPVTGADVPASLEGVEVTIEIAGHIVSERFPALPDQVYTFTWDGLDAYGRRLSSAPARIRIDYLYEMVYIAPFDGGRAFARLMTDGAEPVIGARASEPVRMRREWVRRLSTTPFLLEQAGLGGWSLADHHGYDPASETLWLGNGLRRRAADVGEVINTLAQISSPEDIVVGPDGAIYVSGQHRVRRIGVDGTITTIAGTGQAGDDGDGGPAIAARLNAPAGIDFAPDGSLYIADRGNHRIRRVAPDGIIETVAGSGQPGLVTDEGVEGPAIRMRLNSPYDVAIGTGGEVLIADAGNHLVRMRMPDGRLVTVAGNMTRGFSGDHGPAARAALNFPTGVTVDRDGAFYIADRNNHRIRRVGTDGNIVTIAGDGERGFSGDGFPATQARFDNPERLARAIDGTLYVADSGNHRLRRIGPDGVIETLGGDGRPGPDGDGGPVALARLDRPLSVVADPAGDVLVVDAGNDRIRKVERPRALEAAGEYLVPSADGGEVYRFSARGRHLQTLDALTGVTRFRFHYDSAGRLDSIEDNSHNRTRILRDGSGRPRSVIAPFGQRIHLGLDADGFLSSVTDPAAASWRIEYTPTGLMRAFVDRNGNRSEFTFDNDGRLVRDLDPVGGGWQLAREPRADGYSVVMSSGEGRAHRFAVEHLPEGGRRQTRSGSDGLETITEFDGLSRATTAPDGTITATTLGADPRFGLLNPRTRTSRLDLSQVERTVAIERSVELADPSDLMSLTAYLETTTVNQRDFSRHFDAGSRTWTTITPGNRIETLVLDDRARPLWFQPSGLTGTIYGYDSRGRLSGIARGEGDDIRETRFDYHPEGEQGGLLAGVTDAMGHRTGFEYDAAGHLLRQTLPGEREVRLNHDANGNLVSITPPGRPPHVFAYTAADQRQRHSLPDVGDGPVATRYDYNLDNQLTDILRPGGEQAEFSYDVRSGQLRRLTIPRGSYDYEHAADSGQLAAITAPDGNRLEFDYQGYLGARETWIGEVSGTVSRSHDPDLRISRLFLNGRGVNYQYDPDGFLTAAVVPGTGTLLLERNPASGLVTGTTLQGVVTEHSHNAFGELMASGLQGEATLDLAVLGEAITDDTLQISGTVTGAGRVIVNGLEMQVDAGGAVSGEVALPLVGMNTVNVELYDEEGVRVSDSSVAIDRRPLGSAFEIAQVIAASPTRDVYFSGSDGSSTGLWRIAAGSGMAGQPAWLAEGTLDAGDVSFDGAGRAYRVSGRVITRQDGGSEEVYADLANAGLNQIRDLEVTPDGRVYVVADAALYRVTGHDSVTPVSVTSEADFSPLVIEAKSSAWGLVILTSAGRFLEVHADDTASLLFASPAPLPRTGAGLFGIDDAGRVCWTDLSATVHCRRPDQAIETLPLTSRSLTMGHDGALYVETAGSNIHLWDGEAVSPLLSIITTPVAGALRIAGTTGGELYSVHYERDRLGRVTRKIETLEGEIIDHEYVYDAAGRLSGVRVDGSPVAAYGYDSNGNRDGRVYDDQDRLLSDGIAEYAYTPNGELLTRTDVAGTTRYQYDLPGNLVEVLLPDGTRIEYLVDGRDRRIGKRIDGELVQGFLYQDQLNPVAELDGSGNVLSRFIYADKSHVPSWMIREDRVYRILSDHLGSPRLVIDVASGVIVQRLDYDVWGRIIEDTRPGFQPFGFAGGLHDPDTGLVRFGARDYDPRSGRWTARDPILFAGGDTNLYGYVLNDPINLIDPDGRIVLNLISGGVGAVLGGYRAHRQGDSVVSGAIVGFLGTAMVGRLASNLAMGFMGNIAMQSLNPCLGGFNWAEAATAGALNGMDPGRYLPWQPNLLSGTEIIAHETVMQVMEGQVAEMVGWIF